MIITVLTSVGALDAAVRPCDDNDVGSGPAALTVVPIDLTDKRRSLAVAVALAPSQRVSFAPRRPLSRSAALSSPSGHGTRAEPPTSAPGLANFGATTCPHLLRDCPSVCEGVEPEQPLHVQMAGLNLLGVGLGDAFDASRAPSCNGPDG